MKLFLAIAALALGMGAFVMPLLGSGTLASGILPTMMIAAGVVLGILAAGLKGRLLPAALVADRPRCLLALFAVGLSVGSVALDFLPHSHPGFGSIQTAVLGLGLTCGALALFRGPSLRRIGHGLRSAAIVAVLLVVATDIGARLYTVYDRGGSDSFYHSFFYRSEFYRMVATPDLIETSNPFLIIPPITEPPFNAEGYRSAHSISEPARHDEARVFALGGSTTANKNVRTSYPELWERYYNETLGPRRHRAAVFNAGRDAYSTNQMLVRFVTDIIHLRPDVVTVMEAANDIHELFFVRDGGPQRPRDAKYLNPMYFAPKRSIRQPEGFAATIVFSPVLNRHRMLNILFDRLSSAVGLEAEKTEVVLSEELIGRGLAEYRGNLVALCRLAKANGIRVVLMSQPMNFAGMGSAVFERVGYSIRYPSKEQYMDIHERYTDTMRQVAEQEGAVYVPMKRMFAAQEDTWELFIDGMHYTARGAELFARLSMAYLRSAIDELPPQRAETPQPTRLAPADGSSGVLKARRKSVRRPPLDYN